MITIKLKNEHAKIVKRFLDAALCNKSVWLSDEDRSIVEELKISIYDTLYNDKLKHAKKVPANKMISK